MRWRARSSRYIRQLQPQVVLTFDPIGGYKHPDHIAIQRATLQAFHLAGDTSYVTEDPPFQPQKLYYQVIPKGFLRFAVRLLPLFGRDPRRFGRNAGHRPGGAGGGGKFPRARRHRLWPGLRAQAGGFRLPPEPGGRACLLRSGPVRWLEYLVGRKEYYMRAYPPAPEGLKEKDLFEGVVNNDGVSINSITAKAHRVQSPGLRNNAGNGSRE